MPHTYKYTQNNIGFRRRSRRVLEDYLNMQVFNLDEIENGKFTFPHDIREIFLVKLDLWFRFLMKLEEQFVHIKTDKLTRYDCETAIALMRTTAEKYKNTMGAYPDNFHPKLTPIWDEAHNSLFEYLIIKMREAENMSIIDAFDHIGYTLIEVLRTTLFELFELCGLECCNNSCTFCDGDSENCIIRNADMAYLCLTDISFDYFNKTGKCLLANRLSIYKKHFNIDKVYIKVFSDFGMERMNDDCIRQIEELAEIDYKRSFKRR